MATINSNARQNNFFPSNVKLPNHINNRIVFEEDDFQEQDILNEETNETVEYMNATGEDSSINKKENDKKSEPIEVMVQKFIKKNDKMLLLALAFFLYKQEADIMVVLALCYLAL